MPLKALKYKMNECLMLIIGIDLDLQKQNAIRLEKETNL